MGSEGTTNGSSGRFLRIEEKLDSLVSQVGDFRVDVVERLTKLETTGHVEADHQAAAAQAAATAKLARQDAAQANRSIRWVKVAILSSTTLSLSMLLLHIILLVATGKP